MQYANVSVMRLNLALLMAVSFLPFPTKLLAETIHETDAERAAAAQRTSPRRSLRALNGFLNAGAGQRLWLSSP